MKSRKCLIFLSSMVITIFFFSTTLFNQVEAKKPKKNAFNFQENCGKCHGATPSFPVPGIKEGFDQSGHKNGFEMHVKNAYYANGNGCQKCHTHEGFVEYLNTGKVDTKGYIPYPSQPNCNTCHDPHVTNDFSIRTMKPVTLANKTVVDFGTGNLCANCHMARRDAVSMVKAIPANKIPPYWGPHHGPEADLFAGTSAYQFPEKTYTNSAHTTEIENGCVTCHMALPKKRYSSSSSIGGHSFNISGDVHGKDKVNLSACNTCHKDISQAKGTLYYDIIAPKDYDQDGEKEPVQAEVKGLLDLLVNKRGTGILQNITPPLYKKDGSWNAVKEATDLRTLEQVAAVYNYKLISEDRSLGIHNPTYTIQILYDTISSLDASFKTSHRPE